MSQPDLIAALQEARPVAPAELRERVRLIAVEATAPPRRRITWRRAVVVFVPVAAAIVAAVVLLPRGGTAQDNDRRSHGLEPVRPSPALQRQARSARAAPRSVATAAFGGSPEAARS